MGTPAAGLRGRFRRRVRARLTAEGGWFVALLFGVLIAAVNTGNNLLYLVLGSQLAVLIVSNALAEFNLRGLRVRRCLPDEAYAGEAAAGAFLVQSARRWGAAWLVHIEEQELGEAIAIAARVPAGGAVEVYARWIFSSRGEVALGEVRLWSSYPFGLVRRERLLDAPARMLVFPAPAAAGPAEQAGMAAGTREDPRRPGRAGEFRGLRAYAPGDALRDLHWATTARTGVPMVVERTGERAEEVVVSVQDAAGEAWEANLSRATGQILWHFRLGHAVGLRLAGPTVRPRTGEAWRRDLLARLARAPRREAP